MTTTNTLLAVNDLHAHYGKSHILHGVTLWVRTKLLVYWDAMALAARQR